MRNEKGAAKRKDRGALPLFLALIMVFACLFGAGSGQLVEAKEKTRLVAKSSTIGIGTTAKIQLKNVPAKAKITYKSSNSSVAKVSAKGIVTGVKGGLAKISILVVKGSSKTKLAYKVTVRKPILKSKSGSVGIGSTIKPIITYGISGAKNTYKSSNKSVVSVSSNGTCTGKKVGTAKITIKTTKGKYSQTMIYTVSVKKPEFAKKQYSVKKGETIKTEISYIPKIKGTKISYSTTNASIAEVKNGNVSGVSPGTVTIQAKVSSGKSFSYDLSCNVLVYNSDMDKSYIVRFDTVGGSSISSQSVKNGSVATKPLNPVKEGYVFAGWFTDSENSALYNFNSPVVGDLVLYAKWLDEDDAYFVVRFMTNGGDNIDFQYVVVGGKAKNPGESRKSGSVFTGWYTDPELTQLYDFDKEVKADIILYAGWKDGTATYFNLMSNKESILINDDDGENSIIYLETDVYYDAIDLYRNGELYKSLYDNGNYYENGDDISGDGIYSAVISDAASTEGTIEFMAKVGVYTSNKLSITYYMEISEDTLDKLEEADEQINELLESDGYRELEVAERKIEVEELLDSLADKDLIDPESVEFDEESDMYSYTYDEGILGGVALREFSSNFNGRLSSNDNRIVEEIAEEKNDQLFDEENVDTPVAFSKALILNAFPPFEEDYTNGFSDDYETEAEIMDESTPTEEEGKDVLLDEDATDASVSDDGVEATENTADESISEPEEASMEKREEKSEASGTITEGIESVDEQISEEVSEEVVTEAADTTLDVEFRTKFYETIKSNWDSIGLSTTLDTDVTVDDFKRFSEYDIVCISTHGGTYHSFLWFGRKPAICVKEGGSYKDKKYSIELKTNQIAKVNGDQYWILPEFFDKQYGSNSLTDTFVFSECCEFFGKSDDWDFSMADAVIAKGTPAVVGYHNSVDANYSRLFISECIEKMCDGKSIGDAYDDAKSIYGSNHKEFYGKVGVQYPYPSSDPVAYPGLRGSTGSMLFHIGIENGDFEKYNNAGSYATPRKWSVSGDSRSVSRLGDIVPQGAGNGRFAIITTGIGSKTTDAEGGTEGSYLAQTFVVPSDANTIEFSYDFVSEEPMEYVGSEYDDGFKVQVMCNGEYLENRLLESINTSTWNMVGGGIDFYGGDDTVFQTGWKQASVDVSSCRGKRITLRFLTYDVGDSIYDSAAIIDSVEVH